MTIEPITAVTAPAPAWSMRIAGLDVGELLRGIGEASACTSSVDLFSLCLSAQRVLTEVGTRGIDA